MTPHTPSSTDHPDVDALADLAEQLTDPADEPALREHLARCADCADTFTALDEVQELLGSADPGPMPADIARRIDAALTEARTPRSPAPVGPAPVGPAPVPDRPHGTLPTHPAGAAPGTTGPGRSGRSRRPRRYALLAAAAGAALGFGALVLPLGPGSQVDGTSASDHRPAAAAAKPATGAQGPGTEAGTEFGDATLAAQIRSLVLAARGTTPPEAPAVQAPAEGSGTGPAASPPACAAAMTGRADADLLATGPGRYRTSDVIALVYPESGRPAGLDVYLVTPDCSAPGVLLHRTVPAP